MVVVDVCNASACCSCFNTSPCPTLQALTLPAAAPVALPVLLLGLLLTLYWNVLEVTPLMANVPVYPAAVPPVTVMLSPFAKPWLPLNVTVTV